MKPKRRTGIVTDPRYASHCMGPGELECPERLGVICTMLQEPGLQEHFRHISPRYAGKKELLAVHTPEYIACLEATEGKACTFFDADTRTSPLSHQVALLAAGGLCRAIEQVQAGQLDNAFALIRPPGHHAEKAAAKGFCLYNNVAIGVRYAQKTFGLRRILVVDWDLHHGNGTQHCFEEDPSVLFFSTHRSFFYPGSGKLREVGKGEGRGFTVNIPLLPGLGDGEYVFLFEKILRPVALEFEPEFIMVSAGFDLHFRDPFGGMQVTPQGFAGLTRSILNIADQCCSGKVVMALEGGYDLAGLRDSVRSVLEELAGLHHTDIEPIMAAADHKKLAYLLWRIRRVHGSYWKSLAPSGGKEANFRPALSDRIREYTARLAAFFNN